LADQILNKLIKTATKKAINRDNRMLIPGLSSQIYGFGALLMRFSFVFYR
jgi:hypothetical protein